MIAAIENAIAARLQSASDLGILGYRLKTVATYGGQLDDEESVRRAATMLPACFVVCLGESLEADLGGGRYRMEGLFGVIAAAGNARSERDRRHGGPGAVGTYQMRRDIRTLLTDQTLGLEQGYLVPRGTRPFFTRVLDGLGISVLSVEFSMSWCEEAAGQAESVPAALSPDMVEAAKNLTPGESPTPASVLAAAIGLAPLESINAVWLAPCCSGQGTSQVELTGDAYASRTS